MVKNEGKSDAWVKKERKRVPWVRKRGDPSLKKGKRGPWVK